MGSQVYTTGSGNFSAPITGNITIKVWAGGGGGANNGGGGGGGGFATAVYAATISDSLFYICGAGGTEGSPGEGSYVTDPGSSYIAFAGGGSYGSSGFGGSGGAVVVGTGYVGGNGAADGSGVGGGGGSGAGDGFTGNNAIDDAGGAAPGGNGGAGGQGATSGNSSNGSVYGGGGGGGNSFFSGGGSGAGGRVEFSWTDSGTTYSETMAGGAVVGGSAASVLQFAVTSSGGAVGGSAADVLLILSPDLTGGAVVGGSSSVSEIDGAKAYRIPITVPAGAVAENLEFFLLGVSITLDTGHATDSNFIVTDDTGVRLYHDLRFWDSSTGQAVVFFRCDLSASADNVFWLYYGVTVI
jgi:hypothetical protein